MNIMIALVSILFASEVTNPKIDGLKEEVQKLEKEFNEAGARLEEAVNKLNSEMGNNVDKRDESEITDPEEIGAQDESDPIEDSLKKALEPLKKDIEDLKAEVHSLRGSSAVEVKKQEPVFIKNESYDQAMVIYNEACTKEKPTKTDFEKAKEAFLIALTESEGELRLDCLIHLGRIYTKLGDSKTGKEYFQRCLDDKTCPASLQIESRLSIAEILFAQKNPDLKKELEILNKSQMTDDQKTRLKKINK